MAELEEIFAASLDGDESQVDVHPLAPENAADLAAALELTQRLQSLHTPAPPAALNDDRAAFLDRARTLGQPAPEREEEAFQHSLQLQAAGASADDCAQAHPHYAYELRTNLALVETIRAALAGQVPVRSGAVLAGQRKAFLAATAAQRRAALRERREAARRPQGWLRAPVWARVAAAVVLILALSAFGRTAVTRASYALPGDVLYPVKRVAEQAQLWLAASDSQRAALHERFNQTRLHEAEQVAEQGRLAMLQIPGVIDSMMDGVWMLRGLQQPIVIPGDAVLNGDPATGRQVLIIAYSDGKGQLLARQVEIIAAPVATPTATPTATATMRIFPAPPTDTPRPPLPTATLLPIFVDTATPAPAPTRTPTRTPSPLPSMTATATSEPTATATAPSEPSPTASSEPSPSETPTLEPAPTDTPTPEPAPTDTPTLEPLPTDTPVLQPTPAHR